MTALIGASLDVWMYFDEWTGSSADVGDDISGAREGEDGVEGGEGSSLLRLGMASKRCR